MTDQPKTECEINGHQPRVFITYGDDRPDAYQCAKCSNIAGELEFLMIEKARLDSQEQSPSSSVGKSADDKPIQVAIVPGIAPEVAGSIPAGGATPEPLKPCPFCGGTAEIRRWRDGTDGELTAVVRCTKCRACSCKWVDTLLDDCHNWNSRVPELPESDEVLSTEEAENIIVAWRDIEGYQIVLRSQLQDGGVEVDPEDLVSLLQSVARNAYGDGYSHARTGNTVSEE